MASEPGSTEPSSAAPAARAAPAAPRDVSSTFLHPATPADERVRPPLLVGTTAFKVMWVGLGVLVAVLLVVAVVVDGRLA